MFEMSVEDIFTITGLGTVFAGKILSGSISMGDPILCRARSTEMQVRVVAVRDASGRTIARGEAGATVGVVCSEIKLAAFSDSFEGEDDNRKVTGVTLVTAPKKKHWWSS